MPCLQTSQLRYRYGASPVLDGIDLEVPRGGIYGFLGANGSGKTTTLRLMLGLLSQQGGEIRLFGQRLREDRIGILRRVGAMIESPSFYDHLTAAENLRLLQIVHRCPRRRIDDTLALVGLAHTGRKRTAHFSLGMKQRLGIAVALLHEPELLILDEPTNGLDPNGIFEIRELLQRLNRERGLTLLVSSHLLAEIEKLATHVGILDRGRLVFQGPMRELHERQRQAHGIVLRTGDDATATDVLSAAGIRVQRQDDALRLPALTSDAIASLNRQLVERGVAVYELGVLRSDLEHIFMGMVEGRA
jgi:lantibiotic transport system ATP-binding protein